LVKKKIFKFVGEKGGTKGVRPLAGVKKKEFPSPKKKNHNTKRGLKKGIGRKVGGEQTNGEKNSPHPGPRTPLTQTKKRFKSQNLL